MLLSNETLFLRAPEPEDLELFYEWENDTELWKVGTTISPFSRFILKEYIAAGGDDIYQTRQIRLMIIHKDTNRVVGMADLFDFDPFHRKAAVGILTGSSFQKKGFASMGLELLEDYAFRFLGLHMLYAHIPMENAASLKLFEKRGFERKGILSDWIRIGDDYMDVVIAQKVKASR